MLHKIGKKKPYKHFPNITTQLSLMVSGIRGFSISYHSVDINSLSLSRIVFLAQIPPPIREVINASSYHMFFIMFHQYSYSTILITSFCHILKVQDNFGVPVASSVGVIWIWVPNVILPHGSYMLLIQAERSQRKVKPVKSCNLKGLELHITN